MTAAVYRVVLDTNEIVAAGSRWLDTGLPSSGHNAHLRLLILVATRHRGLYCDEIVDEYARILIERGRPSNRARRLLTCIQGAFTPVKITSAAAPTPPVDPDDEVFLLCALDGDADYLVSEDRHLLDPRPHYQRPGDFDLLGIRAPLSRCGRVERSGEGALTDPRRRTICGTRGFPTD